MSIRRALSLALLALAAGPVAAASASPTAIYQDCQDGKIDGHYSQKDYADALKNVPTDVREYTNCADLISSARLAAAAGGSGGGGAGGGATPAATAAAGAGTANVGKTPEQVLQTATPAQRRQIAAAQGAVAPVQIGPRKLSPVVSGLSPAGAGNVLPTPLLIALALLGLGLLVAAAWLVRSRVVTRRFPAP